MNINEALGIDRLRTGDTKPAGSAPGGEFQSLLDQLRAISSSGEAAASTDAIDFTKAMQRADEDYVALMEMRRALEDAYRSRQP